MNGTQIQTTITPIVGFIAGLLAAKFAWFDSATWTAILMGVVGLGATVWGAVATRKTAMVSTVSAMAEVKSVTLNAAAPGSAALSDATPNNVKVG